MILRRLLDLQTSLRIALTGLVTAVSFFFLSLVLLGLASFSHLMSILTPSVSSYSLGDTPITNGRPNYVDL